jgi:hypothetical protein
MLSIQKYIFDIDNSLYYNYLPIIFLEIIKKN